MDTERIGITGELAGKWQEAINLLADLLQVSTAIVTRFELQTVRVLVSNQLLGSRYKAGDIARADLRAGLAAMHSADGTHRSTNQANGPASAATKESGNGRLPAEAGPDGLSYALPLFWPNGNLFGSICVLDDRKKPLSETQLRTVAYFRTATEADLKSLYRAHERLEEPRYSPVQSRPRVEDGIHELSTTIAKLRRELAERSESERTLRESHQRLQSIVDKTPAVMYLTDKDDRFLFVNARWEDLFGFSSEQVCGKSIYEVFPADIADRFHAANYEVLSSGKPVECEEVAPHDDGPHTYISLKFALRDSAGDAYAVCGVSTDITNRKRAEEKLLATKEWFERLFEDSPFPFWEMDLSEVKKYLDGLRDQGVLPSEHLRSDRKAVLQCARRISNVRFNKAMVRLNEASDERELADWLSAAFSDDSQTHISNLRELIIRLIDHSPSFELESTSSTMTGRSITYLSRVIVPPGCEHTWSRVLISSLDLTERKRTEETTAHLAAIVESSNDAIIATDLQNNIVSWNKGAQALYGYSLQEAIGHPIGMIVPPGGAGELEGIGQRLRSGHSISQFETIRVAKNGERKNVSLTLSPLKDSSGALIGSCGIGRDITQHKRADSELREAKDRYEALFNEAPISLYELDLSGVKKIIDQLRVEGVTNLALYFDEHPEEVARCSRQFKWLRINKTTLRLRGARNEAEFLEWISKTLAEDSSGPFEVFEDNILAFASGSTVYEREVLTPSVGGKWLNILGRVMIMPGFEDSWSRILVSGVDLTELRQAEAARAYLAFIVESSDDAIFGCTLDGLLTSWNRGAERIYGFSQDEVIGRHLSFLSPPDRAEDSKRIRIMLDSGARVEQYESVQLAKDGTRIDVSMTVSPIRNADGLLIGSSIIARDIRWRMKAEQALRQSQHDYSNLVNSIEGIVWRADPATFTFSFVSTHAERMLGYSLDKWLEPDFRKSHIHPQDLKQAVTLSEKAVAEKKDHQLQYRMIHSDGRIVWVHDYVTVIVEDDRAVELRGITVDVTERKKAEEALRKSEEEHRLFFELNLAGNYISTPDGELINCNMSFARMFGFDSVEEAIERGVASLYPSPRGRRAFVELVKKRRRLEYFEEELVRKDGSTVHVIENVIGSFDEGGELVEIRGYVVDDTERKKVEQQLRESQRLEAIGRLAGGVAHDFNNLMTIILGYSQLMLRRTPKADPNYNEALEIRKAGERAAALTGQLLAFSRRQILQPRVFNLNETIADLDKMLRRIIGEDIDLAIIADPKTGLVKADPGQIEQVIVNLSVNSRDAMPAGGRLTIETANVYLDENYSAAHIGAKPGHYVMLAVSDNGSGMNEEIQSHIFEPFFTTKPPGKGTGLGLSTVYGIVKQSGGNIWVYSEPGRGTAFKLYLPRVDEAPGPNAAADTDENEYRGTETVLLVEDEFGVRQLAARSLRDAGFTVVEASSGDEALRLMAEPRGPRIQMLVTDVVMPGLGGKELADRIKQMLPGIKTLFVTGYTDNAVVHHGHLNPGIEILQKPFTPIDLTRKVREVLDSSVRSEA